MSSQVESKPEMMVSSSERAVGIYRSKDGKLTRTVLHQGNLTDPSFGRLIRNYDRWMKVVVKSAYYVGSIYEKVDERATVPSVEDSLTGSMNLESRRQDIAIALVKHDYNQMNFIQKPLFRLAMWLQRKAQ